MVWGGHNLASFSMDNELFYIKFYEKNKQHVTDITIYKNHEIDPNYKFYNQEMYQVEDVVIF